MSVGHFNGKEVKMRERIYKILVKRYENDMEDALLKVDMLLAGSGNPIMVDHIDITGEIDKLLGIKIPLFVDNTHAHLLHLLEVSLVFLSHLNLLHSLTKLL